MTKKPELDELVRSFYLEQAPEHVNQSLAWLHQRAAASPVFEEKVHVDVVFGYIAELTREVMELRMVVEMSGLNTDEGPRDIDINGDGVSIEEE